MFLNKLFIYIFCPRVDLASRRNIGLGWILCRGPETGKVLVLMEETLETPGEKTQNKKKKYNVPSPPQSTWELALCAVLGLSRG